MQPELKFSRFMFHLKFSRKDDYVHEHELYEVMKSRNLYQTQFGLRSNFQKTMRNLAKDEKQRKYNFENTRKLFVQKMKERREHVDKLRTRMSLSINSLTKFDVTPRGSERQYVTLPRSTVVYTELPAINPTKDMIHQQPLGTTSLHDVITLPPAAPSPSMIATNYSGPIDTFGHRLDTGHASMTNSRPRAKSLPAKYMVVTRSSPRTQTAKSKQSRLATTEDQSEASEQLQQNEDLVNELKALAMIQNETETIDNVTERKEPENKAAPHESTVCFARCDADSDRTDDAQTQILSSQSKTKEWAEKHGISKSKMNIQMEHDFQRLMIDRPSKWALDHVHQDRENTQSKILDVRLQQSRKLFDRSLKGRSKKFDTMKLSSKQRLSLPELDTVPKPMVTINPGGTTPDGRLILTKADYEEYLSNYRKARKCRLEQTEKKNKTLKKQVQNFSVDPQLCLRDETGLSASLRTI